MASTALRISEALALQLSDVTRDGSLIRERKFHKSRMVTLLLYLSLPRGITCGLIRGPGFWILS